MIQGEWKNCVITIATDNDLSAAVDLGREYETLLVRIPTIDSANLYCYGCETLGGTYTVLGNGVYATAGTGGFLDVWEIGGFKYIKIGTSAIQTSNRTFKVCGVRS